MGTLAKAPSIDPKPVRKGLTTIAQALTRNRRRSRHRRVSVAESEQEGRHDRAEADTGRSNGVLQPRM